MRRPWRSALFLALAAVGLAALKAVAPDGLYTFGGHGAAVNDALRGVLWLLFLTHVFLAGIMWTQRARWDDAEAATFRFIGVKGLLWLYFALTTVDRNGVNLPYAYLAILIFVTTVDLDIQLARRYVLVRRAELNAEWEAME